MVSDAQHRALPVTLDTALYDDLLMYGDVLIFDFILWVHREFGVGGIFHLNDYAPGETSFPVLSRLLRKFTSKKERQYKSLFLLCTKSGHLRERRVILTGVRLESLSYPICECFPFLKYLPGRTFGTQRHEAYRRALSRSPDQPHRTVSRGDDSYPE